MKRRAKTDAKIKVQEQRAIDELPHLLIVYLGNYTLLCRPSIWPKTNTDTGGEFVLHCASRFLRTECDNDGRLSSLPPMCLLGRSPRMSLHSHASYPIPDDTQRVARAAFPRGNLYLQVADCLGAIYHDAQFAALFPTRGQPAASPARLALATVLQFAEGLSDRQAADAVRSRIDWKYVLGLELTDPGFDHTVLSEFRTRLITGKAEQLLLDT